MNARFNHEGRCFLEGGEEPPPLNVKLRLDRGRYHLPEHAEVPVLDLDDPMSEFRIEDDTILHVTLPLS